MDSLLLFSTYSAFWCRELCDTRVNVCWTDNNINNVSIVLLFSFIVNRFYFDKGSFWQNGKVKMKEKKKPLSLCMCECVFCTMFFSSRFLILFNEFLKRYYRWTDEFALNKPDQMIPVRLLAMTCDEIQSGRKFEYVWFIAILNYYSN